MRKKIDSYQSINDSLPIDIPRRQSTLIPLTIIVLFSISIGTDAYKQLEMSEKNLAEEAKLCMIEFSQKGCDSIRPTIQCSKLI